jgi:FkbH-like protein
MSSFTVDALVDYLDLECRTLGLDPEIYITPFNSWAQEVIGEESGLRRFDPEIAFLSVSIDDLIPELAGGAPTARLSEASQTAVEQLLGVASQFTTWSGGVLVVHSFHSTYRDPQGILVGRSEPGRTAFLAKLNAQLAEGLQAVPRAYLLDVTDLLLRRRGGALDNSKMRHLAAMRFCGPVLGELAHAYACFIAPLKGLARKCVVLDLDNTLWGGIVGEDGAHGIKLGNTSPGSEYQEFQHYLLSLTDRGFLLAINSKNNSEEALDVIRNHEGMILREEAFSAIRVNWRPKPENMLSIAEELNIGVDSMLFLDDNPNERELMRQTLPQVLTPELPADPSLYRATVEALPELQKLVITETDRTRAEQYRAKRQREDTRISAQSLEDYLHSLEIAVEIGHADESNLPRVHQLFERTNQFNLTTRRYPAGELETLAADPDCRLYTLRARDRFGDHGLVATALVRAAAKRWTLDSFLMSCRVIGYGVETALLAAVSDDAQVAGATQLVGEYIESPRNAPAGDFYQRHGFAEMESTEGAMRWRLALTEQPTPCPPWIRMQSRNDA